MNTLSKFIIWLLLGLSSTRAQTGTASVAAAAKPEDAPRLFSKPYLVPDGTDIDKLKDAAQDAATQLWRGYVQSMQFGQDAAIKSYAVLPLKHDIDGDYVALQVRNKFTEICAPQGLSLYTRMDQEWDKLLKEIAWGENYGDTMDPSTIQKFGRIKGVQALVFPRIAGVSKTDKDGVKLRLNVQVFEVETGRQMFGKEIVSAAEGSLVPVVDPQFLKDYRQWFIYGGGALLALFIVISLMRMAARAARPR